MNYEIVLKKVKLKDFLPNIRFCEVHFVNEHSQDWLAHIERVLCSNYFSHSLYKSPLSLSLQNNFTLGINIIPFLCTQSFSCMHLSKTSLEVQENCALLIFQKEAFKKSIVCPNKIMSCKKKKQIVSIGTKPIIIKHL